MKGEIDGLEVRVKNLESRTPASRLANSLRRNGILIGKSTNSFSSPMTPKDIISPNGDHKCTHYKTFTSPMTSNDATPVTRNRT